DEACHRLFTRTQHQNVRLTVTTAANFQSSLVTLPPPCSRGGQSTIRAVHRSQCRRATPGRCGLDRSGRRSGCNRRSNRSLVGSFHGEVGEEKSGEGDEHTEGGCVAEGSDSASNAESGHTESRP